MVLDVSGVQQVDESGAIALTRLWARLRKSGVFCRIRGLGPMLADDPIELLLVMRRSGSDAVIRLLRAVPETSEDARFEVSLPVIQGRRWYGSALTVPPTAPASASNGRRPATRHKWSPTLPNPKMVRSAGETCRVGDVPHPHR